ncbi:DNAase [Vibrio diabolicus]|uniref:DNAase n=1 Tax=Vibrio diabolicus TaxID=50719 RepID=A0AAX1XT14_9VIBR|nr:DNAase [Vibrio diabolicus]RPB42023.1 DNAase [Vibrio diabolicus]
MEKEVIEVVTQSKRALGELKPAFRACPDAYIELCKAVKDGRVSLYRLISNENDLDNYFLWGVAGRGLRSGIIQLCKVVKAAGMSSMTADTAFDGVARLVRSIGVTAKQDGDFIRLDLGVQ